jgi:hypothetical protein
MHERARTVYPEDLAYRQNQFEHPFAETRRHAEAPVKEKKHKKHKMTDEEK